MGKKPPVRRLVDELPRFLAARVPPEAWDLPRRLRFRVALRTMTAFALDRAEGRTAWADWEPLLARAEAGERLYPELTAEALHWLFSTAARFRSKPFEALVNKAHEAELKRMCDDLERMMGAGWFPVEAEGAGAALLEALRSRAQSHAAWAYVGITRRPQDVQSDSGRQPTKLPDWLGRYVAVAGMNVLLAAGFTERQKRENGLSRATAAEFLAAFAREHWQAELSPANIQTWFKEWANSLPGVPEARQRRIRARKQPTSP